MSEKVSVIRTPAYSPELLDEAVARHMAAFGMEKIVGPESKVVLKPNLLMKSGPDQAITTHPELVAAVLRWLRSRGAEQITVADSPGGPYTKGHLEGIYRASGMEKAVQENGGQLNLETGWRKLACPQGLICHEFSIIDPIADADVIINLAKLKTHGMTMLSGAVKNLFGTIPGLQKPELHFRFRDKPSFGRMLVDLCLLVKPTLTIVDAVVSMEGDGPSGGLPRSTGLTFAAANPYALDIALCDYIMMPPRQVPYLDDAISRELCPETAGALEYVGDGRPDALLDFRFPKSKPLGFTGHIPGFLRGPAQFLGEKVLAPVPVVKTRKCTGCGKCAESCAPKAVTIQQRKAVIQYSQCIGCFCCHEMCPQKAIDIRRSRILRF